MSTRNPSRSRSDSSRNCAGFLSQESGAYTIFAVIGFAMLMAFIGLVIDVGRVMNIHSEASSYADRVALAAATELDGRPNALNRALAAAQAIPSGRRLTLSGGDNGRVGFRRLVFMSRLGTDPNNPNVRTPKSGDQVTREWRDGGFRGGGVGRNTADRTSRYVMVETTQEREDYLFFSMMGGVVPGMERSATVAPQAVAGYKRELCNSPPIMVCNPFEGSPFNPTSNAITFSLPSGLQTPGRRSYGLLAVDRPGGLLNQLLGGILSSPDPQTSCLGDTVRVPGSFSLGAEIRALLSTQIAARVDEIPNGRLAVAVVNCRSNILAMLFGGNVAVETYARVDIAQPLPALGDLNVRLNLRFLNDSTPSTTDESLREYPVLVR